MQFSEKQALYVTDNAQKNSVFENNMLLAYWLMLVTNKCTKTFE